MHTYSLGSSKTTVAWPLILKGVAIATYSHVSFHHTYSEVITLRLAACMHDHARLAYYISAYIFSAGVTTYHVYICPKFSGMASYMYGGDYT